VVAHVSISIRIEIEIEKKKKKNLFSNTELYTIYLDLEAQNFIKLLKIIINKLFTD